MHDDVLIPAIVFSTIAFAFWVIFSTIRRNAQTRAVAEIHSRLLEKFGAVQDILAYVDSEAGRTFLQTSAERIDPAGKILGAIRTGTVLAFAGIAELILRALNASADGAEFLTVTGSVLTAVGLGFLVSAAASYKLSKAWGLIPVRS